ncbi:dTMP kinase [Candidatus Parcubacteria bacterium]|nr:dTMP kinase [Candidatus Parcubacteria bacterium]
MAGKFIIIDGIDGSGKATQVNIIINRLKQLGYQVEIADFPQYGTKSAGLVEEYLNGKYGGPKKVGPYIASIFYAADRYDASFKIKKWLKEGKVVISNRYVAANMAHQGSKIADKNEQKKYLKWLYDLEYSIFKIPHPDLNIILHVDADIAQKLVDEKEGRDYIDKKKRDIHEDDIGHLKNAEQVYLKIASAFPDFILIECVKNRQMMSRKKINELIWKKIIKIIK